LSFLFANAALVRGHPPPISHGVPTLLAAQQPKEPNHNVRFGLAAKADPKDREAYLIERPQLGQADGHDGHLGAHLQARVRASRPVGGHLDLVTQEREEQAAPWLPKCLRCPPHGWPVTVSREDVARPSVR
jgi:hypothetical protein